MTYVLIRSQLHVLQQDCLKVVQATLCSVQGQAFAQVYVEAAWGPQLAVK